VLLHVADLRALDGAVNDRLDLGHGILANSVLVDGWQVNGFALLLVQALLSKLLLLTKALLLDESLLLGHSDELLLRHSHKLLLLETLLLSELLVPLRSTAGLATSSGDSGCAGVSCSEPVVACTRCLGTVPQRAASLDVSSRCEECLLTNDWLHELLLSQDWLLHELLLSKGLLLQDWLLNELLLSQDWLLNKLLLLQLSWLEQGGLDESLLQELLLLKTLVPPGLASTSGPQGRSRSSSVRKDGSSRHQDSVGCSRQKDGVVG